MNFQDLKKKITDFMYLEDLQDEADKPEIVATPAVSVPEEPIKKEKPRPEIRLPERPAKQAIMVYTAQHYTDCKEISDMLKSGTTVTVDYTYLEYWDARRLFGFLAGLTYALDGHYQKLSNNVFLYTPSMVQVDKLEKAQKSLENTLKMEWRTKD